MILTTYVKVIGALSHYITYLSKNSLVHANLGFIINSISFCLELDKNCKILFILRLLKKNDWYMIREFAQLLGTLRSLSDNIE